MKNAKKIYFSIGIIGALVLVIGISYALWIFNIAQSGVNKMETDCFKIEFTDKNPISLNNAYPIEDELGLLQKPYTFTLTNVCNGNGSAKYQINLETMNPSGTKLPDKYIKANLSERDKTKITTKLDKSINSKLETETTIDGAIEAYKLVTGVMEPRESKEFNLRLWMDEDVTQNDENSMNSRFKAKISIISSYYQDNRGTLMATFKSNENTFWAKKDAITKVFFEDTMNPYDTSDDLICDVSESQDGSVMSYLVPNEEDNTKYTLYIQGNGGVKTNYYSRSLFSGFINLKSIEGLEYLDTSNANTLSNMFYNCRSLTSLDVSSFNTSKVTDMSYMFENCSNLTSLDLSNFDTSNVTTMQSMFLNCSSLTSLDLSDFDTSNVINMSGMFKDCNKLLTLDISNFNTSNVTSMNVMFRGCSSLTNLDLSNFDTSNVTNMREMFIYCSNLISLNISSFNTSKVGNMAYMFNSLNNLTSLDLRNFDTSNVTDMFGMFTNCGKLNSLDISSFDISKVTDTGYTFVGMSTTGVVYVRDAATQSWLLNLTSNSRPASWTTDNVIIKA